MPTIIEKPVTKPKVKIDEQLRRKLKESTEEKSIVIVHCQNQRLPFGQNLRAWKSTYLIPKGSSEKCKLLHAENIAMHPQWTCVYPGIIHHFTLIFKGLPKGCKLFSLEEHIPQSGAFNIQNIKRNNTDVYRVEV